MRQSFTLSRGKTTSWRQFIKDGGGGSGTAKQILSSLCRTQRVWAYGAQSGNGTACPLYLRKQTLIGACSMSALRQKRTLCVWTLVTTKKCMNTGSTMSAGVFNLKRATPYKR